MPNKAANLFSGRHIPEACSGVCATGQDKRPSGENETAFIESECPTKRLISRPVEVSHRMAALFKDFRSDIPALPETMKRPSGEKQAELMPAECPNCTTSCGWPSFACGFWFVESSPPLLARVCGTSSVLFSCGYARAAYLQNCGVVANKASKQQARINRVAFIRASELRLDDENNSNLISIGSSGLTALFAHNLYFKLHQHGFTWLRSQPIDGLRIGVICEQSGLCCPRGLLLADGD